ncbi:MAG: 23S rRNA (guanine1835-N2)-methyltransferase [Paraglaciecola sp.]|jgi:23S rRNA (guanine1835-N2)-methyltransferase
MNTSLTLLDKTLKLVRYPENLQHISWQAWDSADEYLITHLEETISDLQNKKIRIYNDDFGTLGCWFAKANPCWFSDSFVAYRSCVINLQKNQIQQDAIQFYNSLQQPTAPPELVVLKIPKTTALLEQQLIDLQAVVSADTLVVAGAKANLIQKSTLALFEKYLGPTHTSLAKKKARLIFCQPSGDKKHTSPYPTVWRTTPVDFEISNLANVFGRQQLDIGTRFLLQHLPNANNLRVIDLGCGNGVLGLHVLQRFPSAKLIFVDESHMAIASAKQNVMSNMPDKFDQCEFLLSNCLDDFEQLSKHQSVDLVLCNPPFHQQNTITDHIAVQMFKDAKRVLAEKGLLYVVGNRHLDYPLKLKRLFGGHSMVASDRKFSILAAIKT